MLGPFAKALSQILNGDTEKERTDALDRGNKYHNPGAYMFHPRGFLCRTFIVFRGLSLPMKSIKVWTSMIGKRRYIDK